MSTRRTGNDPTTGKPGPVDAVRNPDGSISLVRRGAPMPPPVEPLEPLEPPASGVVESRSVARLRERGLLGLVERYAAKHHVTVADILGRGRRATVVAARHDVWRELRETTAMSLPEIGALFDRDHTTVLVAVRGLRKAHPVAAARSALRAI